MKISLILSVAFVASVLADQEWVDRNEAFLKENKEKDGVITTASGLQYKVIQAGTGGVKPGLGDKCNVHYEGQLIDGKQFDSSIKRGKMSTFRPSQVVRGWTEALQLMSPGDKWELYVPPSLGYGMKDGRGPGPGGSVLIFQLELVSLVGPSAIPIIGPLLDYVDLGNNMHVMLLLFTAMQVYMIFFAGKSHPKVIKNKAM